jgi:replicative DNA helicase
MLPSATLNNSDLTPDFDRDRPLCSIECEEALLGGILFDPQAMARVADILPPDAFFITAHQQIYRTAQKLHFEGATLDMIGVTCALADAKQLDDVGGRSKIAQLAERTVGAVNIDYYAAVIADKYVRRQMRQLGVNIANSAGDTTSGTSDLLAQARNAIDDVQSLRPIDKPQNVRELASDWFDVLSARMEGTYQDPRLKSGLYDLDDLLDGGFRPTEQLVTVLADTGCGKTTLALQMAWNIAEQTSEPVVFFSLEMGKEELTERLLAMISGIEISRHSSLSREEMGIVLNAMEKLSNHPNFYLDDTAETISEIREVSRKIKQENGGKLAAVFIDYVQLIKPEESTGNKVQDYDAILKELKRLTRSGKGLNTSVFTLSQVTRTIRDRQNKRPTKHDGLWCSSIERDSNILLSVYRDEIYNPDTVDRGVAEISVLKNRSGSLGVTKVLYEPAKFRFLNMLKSGRFTPQIQASSLS